jgi:chromosome segregation ATPase
MDYPPDEIETIRREMATFRAEVQASKELFQHQSAEVMRLQSDLNLHRQKMRSLLNKLAQRIQHLKTSEQEERLELLTKIDLLEKQTRKINAEMERDSIYSLFQREGLRQKAWRIIHFVLRRPVSVNVEPAGAVGGKFEKIEKMLQE